MGLRDGCRGGSGAGGGNQTSTPLPVRSSDSDMGPLGVLDDRISETYAGYYFTSVPVYAAIKLRADAVARPGLKVYRVSTVHSQPRREWVGHDHPAQELLDRVNPHWTGGDLWRATETYLNLWGESYWAVERDEAGVPIELWPLRPDRVRVVPDETEYIRGVCLYRAVGGLRPAGAGRGGAVALLQSPGGVRGTVTCRAGAPVGGHGSGRSDSE